jgi:hypothetical protein
MPLSGPELEDYLQSLEIEDSFDDGESADLQEEIPTAFQDTDADGGIGQLGAHAHAAQRARASILPKTLIPFSANVPEKHRFNLEASFLIAILRANRAFGNPEQGMDWYKEFVDVLMHIGFEPQSQGFIKYRSQGDSFSVARALLEVLRSATMTPDLEGIVEGALDALRRLGKEDDTVKLFEHDFRRYRHTHWQIVPVVEVNGQLAIRTFQFSLETSQRTDSILFAEFESNRAHMSFQAIDWTYIPELFRIVRGTLIRKLGRRLIKYVKHLDI